MLVKEYLGRFGPPDKKVAVLSDGKAYPPSMP